MVPSFRLFYSPCVNCPIIPRDNKLVDNPSGASTRSNGSFAPSFWAFSYDFIQVPIFVSSSTLALNNQVGRYIDKDLQRVIKIPLDFSLQCQGYGHAQAVVNPVPAQLEP